MREPLILPEKVRGDSRDFVVVRLSEGTCQAAGFHGYFDPVTGEIGVTDGGCDLHRGSVFLHELVHLANHDAGVIDPKQDNDVVLEEDVAERTSLALLRLLARNPAVHRVFNQVVEEMRGEA